MRRLLPASIRPVLRDAATALLPSAPMIGAQASGRVTVAGMLTSQSGLGETARLSTSALLDLGWTVGQIDLTRFCHATADTSGPPASPRLISGDAGGPILLHLNPPNFQSALLLHAIPRQGRKLIAYWTWELPRAPVVWQRAFRLPHEIWVPTNFVADALRESGCGTPIRVVAYPVRPPVPTVRSEPRDREKLRILTVFAYDSGFERKNPLASVAAFRQAFGNRDDVELIIKTRGHSDTGEPEQKFTAAIAGAGNVRVLAGTMTPAQYADLLAGADIVLSLHRAEGFGLVLAEAMLLGKPVVATAWSGNLDFMDHESACLVPATMIPAQDDSAAYRELPAEWAEPSVPAAAEWLRRLQDPSLRASIGEAARRHAAQRLGPEQFMAEIAASLGDVTMGCEIRGKPA